MSTDILNNILFDDKTVRDVIKDIYSNVKEEDIQIKNTIEKLMESFTNGGEDANISDIMAFIAPVIKDYIDLSIKNKKQLIDLAKVLQQMFEEKNNSQEEILSSDPRFMNLLKIQKDNVKMDENKTNEWSRTKRSEA